MTSDDEPKKGKQQPRGDYQVGYARTPEHSRFKPGNQIGKKGGRPKGRKNNATLLREILEFKIDMVLPGGTSRRVSLLEAATWQTATKALRGDARAYAEIKNLAGQVGIEINEPPEPDEALTAYEEETLAQYNAVIAAEAIAKHKSVAEAPSSSASCVSRVLGRPTVRRVTFGPRGMQP